MRFLVSLLFLVLLSNPLFSQNEISVQNERRMIDKEFSVDMVYSKKTGKKLGMQEFTKLVSQNPNLPLEPVYDNRGKVVKYLYDPEASNTSVTTSTNSTTNTNSRDFPPLELKTITGETIKIKDLKGKLVILRMEMEAHTFRFKKDEIASLDEAIENSGRKSDIEAIIIFGYSTKDQVQKGFDLENTHFKAIADGKNFQRKLNITYYPATIILDENGKLIDTFRSSKDIDLDELLKN